MNSDCFEEQHDPESFSIELSYQGFAAAVDNGGLPLEPLLVAAADANAEATVGEDNELPVSTLEDVIYAPDEVAGAELDADIAAGDDAVTAAEDEHDDMNLSTLAKKKEQEELPPKKTRGRPAAATKVKKEDQPDLPPKRKRGRPKNPPKKSDDPPRKKRKYTPRKKKSDNAKPISKDAADDPSRSTRDHLQKSIHGYFCHLLNDSGSGGMTSGGLPDMDAIKALGRKREAIRSILRNFEEAFPDDFADATNEMAAAAGTKKSQKKPGKADRERRASRSTSMEIRYSEAEEEAAVLETRYCGYAQMQKERDNLKKRLADAEKDTKKRLAAAEKEARKNAKVAVRKVKQELASAASVTSASSTNNSNKKKSVYQKKWDASFEEMKRFKLANGTSIVPPNIKEVRPLYSWATKQRTEYNKFIVGKPAATTQERIDALNSIGFEWVLETRNGGYAQLKKERDNLKKRLADAERDTKKRLAAAEKEARKNAKVAARKAKQDLASATSASSTKDNNKMKNFYQKKWDASFEEMKRFKIANGTFVVPPNIKEVRPLYSWATKQRTEYNKFIIGKPSATTQERIDMLNSIGFEWGQSLKGRWDANFHKLVEFKAANGHTNVPLSKGDNFGNWVSNQRDRYRRFREGLPKSFMSQERIDKLNSIDFSWEETHRSAPGFDKDGETWEDRYAELQYFRSGHGHTRVPQRYKERPKLGRWVSTMRVARKKYQPPEYDPLTGSYAPEKEPRTANGLDRHRIELLDAIDFEWSSDRVEAKSFDARLVELADFVAVNGHAKVGQKAPGGLGLWVNRIRTTYNAMRKGRSKPSNNVFLTDERIATLDRLGFLWETQRCTWEERFEQIVNFRRENGHVNIPADENQEPTRGLKENIKGHRPSLWRWTIMQKIDYKRYINSEKTQILNKTRIKKLEDLGFTWDDLPVKWGYNQKRSWEQHYERLQQYVEIYGNTRVPQKWKEDPSLGNWVSHQRTFFKHFNEGRPNPYITRERIRRLEEVGFEWNTMVG